MGNPEVTVLIALRNGIEFLPEALASVQEQTMPRWRVLVGVNGHPEGPEVFSEARRRAGAKVSVLDLPGAANKPAALNAMAAACGTPWIAVLDADDLWLPAKLERQMPLLKAGWDVVGTRAKYFGDDEGPVQVMQGRVTFADLLERNHVVNSSVVMRRELAVWPDTDGLDDYPLWLELAKRGARIFNLPEALTKIRRHPGQHFAGVRDNSEEIRERYRNMV